MGYKDKGVMMASRSLITLFRSLAPELLHKKDRGRPTEATTVARMKQFGESDAVDFIAGAEILAQESEENEEGDSDDDDEEDEEDDEAQAEEKVEKKNDILTLEEKEQKARDATLGRILTDEDFRKIAAAQLRKQVEGVRKVQKRGTKRKAQDDEDNEDEWINVDHDDEDESLVQGRQELVNLDDIELVHKKKRHDKEARMETVLAGRKRKVWSHQQEGSRGITD